MHMIISMASSILRLVLVPNCFSKSCALTVYAASTIKLTIAKSINYGNSIHINSFLGLQVTNVLYQNMCFRFSTIMQPERICWEGSSHDVLLKKLETAFKDRRVDEAWEAYNDFKNLYGFPKNHLMGKLIIKLSYSSDAHWLQKAFDIVLVMVKEKPDLLHHDFLIKLSLSLARAQMPIPTSTVLRLMLEKDKFPPMDIWRTIFLHMLKTEIGTCLASNILFEVCDCCVGLTAKKSKCSKLMNPDTMIFNLVLDACVRFQSTLMGQQIIELMAHMGVIANASSIVLITQIYQLNGQREDLKKFKVHIDNVSIQLLSHYWQFYDTLLNLHFKFNDIDAAAELVLDLNTRQKLLHGTSHLTSKDIDEQNRLCFVSIGSCNVRNGLRVKIEPELLQNDFVSNLGNQSVLFLFKDGKLVLSNKGLAKFINAYKKEGKISELSKLLISIQKGLLFSGQAGLCSDVMDACIHLDWLEAAHDILDDIGSAGIPLGSITYISLLRAYCQGGMFREAKALLKQMKKANLQVNLSEEVISTRRSEVDLGTLNTEAANANGKTALAESLIREMREEEKATPSLVYEIDSSIYFFCKTKMIEDAIKSYRRMQEKKIQPTIQTFASLVNGYSSLEMYREITILWGDIKRCMDNGHVVLNWDFFVLLLWNFIRGGYFERVMEVIDFMRKHGMYIDKWKYKREFIKFHKDLYRNLKASKAKTEAQSKRLEYVRTFRKWVGID